ncbi:MAG: N-acetylmannosamine-6-phosphate 2-epimerase [Clostridium sp.]|uniref:N-acetylmannosamine-6-phosphate 2-epimerase n=1 Tax=Clostridium sp. TaxID=1506 RepID=UPI00290E9175|nr:N-acetylmannosamine-6-phosphate 2-epimerase [Clostridium sp.]MDU5110801.1 N-acetylmannosamine-6-phosphate 2-epimerase [Clostridium sp.]
MDNLINSLKGEIIVSCQAFEEEPFHGSEYMVKMAESAKLGGAKFLRACWPNDISAIKKVVNLPIIGINKIICENLDIKRDVIITPTFEAAKEIYYAGADIIAVDCTRRARSVKVEKLLYDIKSKLDVKIMADISTLEEGLDAIKYGADIVSTTLSGYTYHSSQSKEPDYDLIYKLRQATDTPINAEGRYWEIAQVKKAFENGAWCVTIGGAITRPHLITERFIKAVKGE